MVFPLAPFALYGLASANRLDSLVKCQKRNFKLLCVRIVVLCPALAGLASRSLALFVSLSRSIET